MGVTMLDRGLLIVLSGPSGAGKGTICSNLRAEMPNLVYSVSMTTREPRVGEVEGKNYFFRSKDEFESLLAEVKELKSENESLKSKLAKDALGDVMDQVEEVKGVKVLATSLEDVDMNGLRELGDNLKEKLGEGVIVLASQKDGKVFLVAMVTDEAQKAGAHAGNLIKAIAGCVGGGGGGRPNMAQAGGKNPAGIPEAVAKVKEILESQIS